MKENEYSKKVTDYVKSRGGEVFNYLGTTFTRTGTPDLLVAYRGAFVALELKVGNNKPSAIQKYTVNMLNDQGAFSAVVYDTIEPVKNVLDMVDEQLEDMVGSKGSLNSMPDRFKYTGGTK